MLIKAKKQAVVVSAMGKTTNALEEIWQALPQAGAAALLVDAILEAHFKVSKALDLPASVLNKSTADFPVNGGFIGGAAAVQCDLRFNCGVR